MSNPKSHDPTVIAPARTKGYLAHVRQDNDGSFVIHHLEEHLRAVADLAGGFASTFGHADWGRLAGLWHNLGKYFAAFQKHPACGNGIAIWMQRIEV